ncbi:MAG: hypothetical protein QM811_08625 [Pirellulales bacterium]
MRLCSFVCVLLCLTLAPLLRRARGLPHARNRRGCAGLLAAGRRRQDAYARRTSPRRPFLVVLFTCNHCPTAQAYEERIIALHADYKDRGVALVAISPNDDQAVRLDELGTPTSATRSTI